MQTKYKNNGGAKVEDGSEPLALQEFHPERTFHLFPRQNDFHLHSHHQPLGVS
jgi:hypothetical protein